MRCLFVMFKVLFILPTVRSRRAFLDIILYEINENDGRYTMRKIGITGEFSNAGTASTAEGDIIQMHPRSLCEDFEDNEKFDYGWVGVVKLSYHGADPCHLVEKAQRAVGQGATAVIFDISDHPDALRQLNEHSFNAFNQPIVLVKGMDATQLMKIINGEHIARAVIKQGQPNQGALNGHFTDPALLVTCILLVFVVLCIGFSKMRCRKRQQQASLRNWTVRHSVAKKYTKDRQRYDAVPQLSMAEEKNCSASYRSSATLCAICLESFQIAQDLRVLECQHEFHMHCIDTWLTQKRSCPLCNRSFSNLSAKSHSAAQRNEDAVRRQQDADGTAARPNMQQIRPNLMDANLGMTSYGAILSQNENTVFLPLLSNSTEEGQDMFEVFSSSDTVASDVGQHAGAGSCVPDKRRRTVFDHRDPVLQSHRKGNPRGSTLDERIANHPVNFSIAPRTKLRASCRGTYGCAHPNCDLEYQHQGMNFETDSSCTERTDACDENCNCRVNGASETSILALHGSLPFLKSSSSSFFSPSLSITSKCVEYSSDPPVIAESESSDQHLFRSPTPCIEYSSSDGASNLCWLSYSTLEDVLGAIDSSTSGLSN